MIYAAAGETFYSLQDAVVPRIYLNGLNHHLHSFSLYDFIHRKNKKYFIKIS